MMISSWNASVCISSIRWHVVDDNISQSKLLNFVVNILDRVKSPIQFQSRIFSSIRPISSCRFSNVKQTIRFVGHMSKNARKYTRESCIVQYFGIM
jgi:hypothetical protein